MEIIESQIKVPAADWLTYIFVITTSCVLTICKRKGNPHRVLVSLLASLFSRSNQLKEASYTDAITLGIVFHHVNSREIQKELIAWVPQSYVLIVCIKGHKDFYVTYKPGHLSWVDRSSKNGNETFWVNQSQES